MRWRNTGSRKTWARRTADLALCRALARAGLPAVRIRIADAHRLGRPGRRRAAPHRHRIREELAKDFGSMCGYCETSGFGTTDHFRPRSRFPHLTFEWLNLVYACHRCNQAKGNSWPGFDDQSIDMWLVAESPRFTPISEYVTPNAEAGRRAAQEHFEFRVETGEIRAAEQLSDEEWSMARRTIRDVDLNDSRRGENDPGHLLNRRRRQRRLLEQRLSSLSNPIQHGRSGN